jgi:hypothetical protein
MVLTSDLRPLISLLPKRHSQSLQKRSRLLIVARRGNDRDVHSAQLIYLIEVNLGED